MRITRAQMNLAAIACAEKQYSSFEWTVSGELTRLLDQHGNVAVVLSDGDVQRDLLLGVALFNGEDVYWHILAVPVFAIACAFQPMEMKVAAARAALKQVRKMQKAAEK
jgi:hypothetical protein